MLVNKTVKNCQDPTLCRDHICNQRDVISQGEKKNYTLRDRFLRYLLETTSVKTQDPASDLINTRDDTEEFVWMLPGKILH